MIKPRTGDSSRPVIMNEVKNLERKNCKRDSSALLQNDTMASYRMTRSIVLLGVLPLLFFSQQSSAETLRIPYVSISGFQAPLYLGERAGLFKKNQLEAQLIYMPGGSLIVQTLLSGEVGVASLAPPSALNGSGMNLSAVSSG